MSEQFDQLGERPQQPLDDLAMRDRASNDVSPGASAGVAPAQDDRPTTVGGSERRPDTASAGATERPGRGDAQPGALLPTDVAHGFLARWEGLQAAFIDEPHRVVEQADSLVAEVIQRITDAFVQERNGLKNQWASNDQSSTEALRLTLQHYRSVLRRLLSA